MLDDLENKKPEIDYPCQWGYRVIGADGRLVREAIAAVVADAQHTVEASNTSRTGKYCAFALEMTVTDEAHRNAIFEALKAHPDVRMVL